MKIEVNSNDRELKARILQGEIRESKKEKDKYLQTILGLVSSLVILIIGSVYFFFIKGEQEILAIAFFGFLLLLILFLGYYWYNKYQKANKKIKKLEREIYLLKLKKQGED